MPNISQSVCDRVKKEIQALSFHSLHSEPLYNPAPVLNSFFHIPCFVLRCLYGNYLMIEHNGHVTNLKRVIIPYIQYHSKSEDIRGL